MAVVYQIKQDGAWRNRQRKRIDHKYSRVAEYGTKYQHKRRSLIEALFNAGVIDHKRVSNKALAQIYRDITGKRYKSHRKTAMLFVNRYANGSLSIATGDKVKARHAHRVADNSFLSSYQWRKIRYKALLKSHGKCELCGRSPEDGIVLNVDHIKPRKQFPDLALDINNLQVLCNECNHGKSNWDQTDWRKA